MNRYKKILEKRKAEIERLRYGTFEQQKQYLKIKTRNINIQMERARKHNIQQTKRYKELEKIVGGRAKIGKITKGNIEEKIRKIEKAESYDLSKYFKDIAKKISGVNLGTVSDFLELQKSSIYKDLREYFSSDEILEVTQMKSTNKSIGYMFDRIQSKYAGEMVDEEDIREMLLTGKFLDGEMI